ncbi:MAG TPA: hypothetical protein VKS20_14975 [Candidatus Acidoferrales bacterium]|nr:hypothetical protein [Candidatus Acidoferrales bacterium]
MLEVAIISLVMIVLSILGLVWDFASGLIASGVDGILLLLVCLMIGGVFSLQLLLLARENMRSRNGPSGSGK